MGLHLIMPVGAAEGIWSHLVTRFAGNLSQPGISPSPGTPVAAEIAGWKGRGEGFSLPILNPKSEMRNAKDSPHPNLLPTYREKGPEGKRALRPIGWAAFNACRIEAGRPIFGIDFDDSILPAETGQLARAVSFTKGCYPGQEVVARMYARQQVAKQIVGLKMESDALPIAGAQIFDDNGNAVGGVTSSTISPILSNAALCLGLVKRPFFAIGTKLTIPAEGAMHKATVVEMPFRRE
jgi:folate-binding protein YgfZ